MNEVILTQDVSSGRVHRRYRMPGGQLASFEGCNLDQAGAYRIVSLSEFDGLPVADRCRRCFPEDDGSTQPVEMVP